MAGGHIKLQPEEAYRLFGRLLENVPDFSGYGTLSVEQLKWLGRVEALVKEVGDTSAYVKIGIAVKNMLGPQRADAFKQIMLTLYGEMAAAELRAPQSAQGAFVPVASAFDAFAAISKLFQSAKSDVLLVDPYLDETVLTEFGTVVSSGIAFRLLSDSSTVKPSLAPAANKWATQYGASRPLSVRPSPPKTLHDRAIFIDQTTAWTLTQSLKDFARRSPAEVVRADDTAALKIAAYEQIWALATVVV
jgi:hypothetical protein